MIYPFKNDFPITQGFGENPQDYARFGLIGHNGIDFGCPSGTELIAPIAGTVLEVADDPTGYGLYIKIENDSEGCLLAHMQTQDVTVGQFVDQGQHLGYSDNTGNSTGAHLHFGYYKKPRDRSNGYAGYIDPTPFFNNDIILPVPENDMPDYLKNLFQENSLDVNNEGAVRAFFQKAIEFDGVKTDLTNCQIALEKVPLSPEITPNPIDSSSPSPTSQFSLNQLLVELFKRILGR